MVQDNKSPELPFLILTFHPPPLPPGLTVHLAGCLASQEALLSLYGAPSDVGLSEELAALAEAIPGQPGEDYPVYSVPPDTSFSCDGKIEGYYGDPEADCQSFHICANDGIGGLLKYTFLCPNGGSL